MKKVLVNVGEDPGLTRSQSVIIDVGAVSKDRPNFSASYQNLG
jgi:hypothetical protein